MKINVNHRVETKDGGKFVTLLVKKNPHTVSDDVGETLIKEGKATALVAAPLVQLLEPKKDEGDVELDSMTVTELRAMAKELKISGASEMTKAVLIEAIENASEDAGDENQ